MTNTEQQNIELIRSYLAAVQNAAQGDALARFFTADAIQIELPNRLNPNGGRSDLVTLIKRAELVPTLLRSQRYDISSELAQGDVVIVEAIWNGELAVAFGNVPPGTIMKAHFAMFFIIENGRIKSQRNYDCFEPW
jgi:ketosteroid isomerase-like protein